MNHISHHEFSTSPILLHIVYSCVADSSGVIVSESDNPMIDNVVEVLLESSIDFLIDHKKSFSGHSKTKGYVST